MLGQLRECRPECLVFPEHGGFTLNCVTYMGSSRLTGIFTCTIHTFWYPQYGSASTPSFRYDVSLVELLTCLLCECIVNAVSDTR